MLPLKQFAKKLLLKNGYDLDVHRCSPTPYEGPKIAFVHIAKSGGISVDTALRQALAMPKQRRIDRHSTIVASQSSFSGTIDSLESACDFSEHHAKILQNTLRHYLALEWSYISGHIAVNQQTLAQFSPQYNFITVLRDPVKRFISNYIFNKLTNKSAIMPPNAITTDNLIEEAKSIIDSRRGWHMANTATMCITGRFPNNAEQAKSLTTVFADNLSSFKIVGFLSQLEKFALELEALSGRAINIKHRNALKSTPNHSQAHIEPILRGFFSDKTTLKKVNDLCKYEMVNYNEALAKYGE